jgi:predicted amidohydrolase YtcJ
MRIWSRLAGVAVAVAVVAVAACAPSAPAPEVVASPSTPPPAPADLILHNGVVITVDGAFSLAQAVAVTDGRIVAVGSSGDVLRAEGSRTRVVDLEGRTVLPGFVDPHVHYIQNQAPELENMLPDQEALLSWGRTTVGIPSVIPINLEGFQRMVEADSLILRIHAYLQWNNNCGDPEDTAFWDDYTFERSTDHRFTIAGVKVFMDGGSCHGPAVSFNFDDAPIGLPAGWTGHGDLFTTADELVEVVRRVDARGGQVVVHAIGDRAVAEALDGFAEALDGGPNPNGHRIDHNTFLRPELTARYGEIGVNAVVWGVFNSCIEPDAGWASFLNEDQLPWLRRHRMLLDENPDISVAFHSDVPHTEGNPFHQLLGLTEMAQFHEDFGGECDAPPWLAGHSVTTEEALRMMTIWAAEVMGIDDEVGSIEVGKRADLVVLANNPLEQSGFDLLDNHVSATIIDGEAVWCDDFPWCEGLE